MNCGVCNHREVCRCFPNPEEYCSDYEPERSHGEWIESINDNICSVCKQNSLTHWKAPFCPNCGADMRGEANIDKYERR